MTQATPSFETLRYAVEDGVATITLHARTSSMRSPRR